MRSPPRGLLLSQEKKREEDGASKLQDHIRRETSADSSLAGSKRRLFFFFFFFVTNSSPPPTPSSPAPPPPQSSPQSRGCPVQLVGPCASMFPSLPPRGCRTCTTAQFTYIPACLNPSTFVAEVDLSSRALASGPPRSASHEHAVKTVSEPEACRA